MHLTDKAGHKFISDDLVKDVYKNPEILQVRYKTKYDIKRKNKTPVYFTIDYNFYRSGRFIFTRER